MALVVDIRVNSKQIGQIVAVRREGGVGKLNRYECTVEMSPDPLTGHERVFDESIWVDHHYNDGALGLIRKVIEGIQDEG